MRRRANADHNAFDTINAAATVIASGENHVPHVSSQKRRWRSWWSVYWCFGNHRQRKRIGHAALSSDTSSIRNEAPAAENSIQAPAISLPFVAPPSSPASFLQSEPPSAAQSPAGMVSHMSISASMYSPSGPASIFAIGPYAHETQSVSPPVFSAFTTEPSTAPFTPPPESMHLTTPSSPEVPFAQLLDPGFRNGEGNQRFPFYNYEFQSYHLHPGSPIGHLISPSSGISGSGTSSPFPDGEFNINGPHFLEFRSGNPPKLLNLDKLSKREWGSCQGSGSLTPDSTRISSSRFPLDRQYSDVASHSYSDSGYQHNQVFGRRVSIDLTAEDVLRRVEQKCQSPENKTMTERMACSNEPTEGSTVPDGKTTTNGAPETTHVEVPRHQKQQSISLAPTRDVNLDNNDDDAPKRNWWASIRVSANQNCNISYGTLETTHADAPRHQKQGSFALAPPGDFNVDTNDEDASKAKLWANVHGPESRNDEISDGAAETTHVNAPRHQKQESFALAPTRNFNLDSNDEDGPKPNWWANSNSSESQNSERSDGTTQKTCMNGSRHQFLDLDPITDFNFDNDNKDAPKLIWWANRHSSEIQHGDNCTKTLNTTDGDMPCHQKQHSITLSPIGDFNVGNDNEDDTALNVGSDNEDDTAPRPNFWASSDVSNDVAATKNWSFFPMTQPRVI